MWLSYTYDRDQLVFHIEIDIIIISFPLRISFAGILSSCSRWPACLAIFAIYIISKHHFFFGIPCIWIQNEAMIRLYLLLSALGSNSLRTMRDPSKFHTLLSQTFFLSSTTWNEKLKLLNSLLFSVTSSLPSKFHEFLKDI